MSTSFSSALTGNPALTQTSLSGNASLPQAGAGANRAQVRKAAEQFEQMFVSQMVGHMFESVGTDSMFGGGDGEKMFRSMLTDEYGKQISRRGGLGIADAVMKTLLAEQEKAR